MLACNIFIELALKPFNGLLPRALDMFVPFLKAFLPFGSKVLYPFEPRATSSI